MTAMHERLSKLEAKGGDPAARRRLTETDAAHFEAHISALADRSPTTATPAEFEASIRTSGDPFLIATFLGEDDAHR